MRAQLIWKPWLSLTRTSRVQIRRRAYFQLLLQRLASSASAGPKNSWSCMGWQDLRALVTSQSSCCQRRAKLDLMVGHLDIWHHRRQTCSSKPSFLILQGNLAVDVLRPIQQRQLPSAGRQSVKSVVEMEIERTRTASISNPGDHCTLLARHCFSCPEKVPKSHCPDSRRGTSPRCKSFWHGDSKTSSYTPTAGLVTPVARVAPVGSGLPTTPGEGGVGMATRWKVFSWLTIPRCCALWHKVRSGRGVDLVEEMGCCDGLTRVALVKLGLWRQPWWRGSAWSTTCASCSATCSWSFFLCLIFGDSQDQRCCNILLRACNG